MLNFLPRERFQELLLRWFDDFGRKNLPWQQNKTPYRVWISEIMLQQTQVSTVIPYFIRFIEHFPTIQVLANATEDEIMHIWTGLGYYTRARNLHRAAIMLHQTFHGKFPAQLDALMTLPGIGRTTAGAILAIAFEKRAAILDGNVKRVLSRLHGMTDWLGEKRVLENLWSIAEHFTPEKRVADYTQAMMDLGATVCTRGKPHCGNCPFKNDCLAHIQGLEKIIPLPKLKKQLPIRQTTFLILQNKHSVLLEKRPSSGIWGGLWCLPEIPGFCSEDEVADICKKNFRLKNLKIDWGTAFRHTFTHFHLEILPVIIQTQQKILEHTHLIWYNLLQPVTIGLPMPVKSILADIKLKLNLRN